MNEDNFLIWSDGKNIKITSSEFIVDSARYLIKSIRNVRLHFVRHFKYPAFTILIAGVICMIAGLSGWLDNIRLEELYIGNLLITANRLFFIVGGILAVLGMLWLSILQNEYVVIISMDDGEWNPVSGKKRDELSKIVTALKKAISIGGNEI
jgi:hypothetical protein